MTLGIPLASAQDFRYVYVPVDDLDVLFSARPRVLLKRQEFLELWNQAHPAGRTPAALPNELLLTGGRFSAAFAGDALQIAGEVEIIKQQTGWQSVVLPLAGVSIASATLDGEPAKLGVDTKGRTTLFVREPGTHRLRLELSAPVGIGTEARIARLRLPPQLVS